ncbi:LuxR C-terminal-related transcriptional regulator [Marmoricola sp. RAF53]|uniref:helix-turn-helix transcriptional regulator n=1 Tax=Marmoricola sp. RAF53 TaxID=3233059 RepID=UPI003F95EC2C
MVASQGNRRRTGTEGAVEGAAPVPVHDHGVPRLPRVYVARTRLWDELDRAAGAAVTLVVAPVGAGKTLGVAGWPRLAEADSRWLLGGPDCTPEAIADVLAGQQGRGPDGAPGLVVVDDAHQLPSATLRLLERRLNDEPDALRIVLISRWDLPFGRLVPELLGHFASVRGELLEMTDAESEELVRAHARTTDPGVIKAITRHARGWCAAVVLTARAVAASPSPQAAARLYADGSASVADRLATEVFSALKPRERHLLLCIASEGIVTTELAEHLSHDPHAADVLEGLEATGLFVTRVPDRQRPRGRAADPDHDGGSTRYRIHPLMVEIVRRRLVAGGVDVVQAQSTVSRAVRLDIHRGETADAFDRLVAAQCHGEAARVLADLGPELLLRGRLSALPAFVRRHPDVVDGHPRTWFTLGLDRWLANDTDGAGHWLDRAITHGAEDGEEEESRARLACMHLVRARMGAEPLATAVGEASAALASCQDSPEPHPVVPLLALELGICRNWDGDHERAEADLTTAIALGKARGLSWLTADALSHLALALFFQGREHAALGIADKALEALGSGTWHSDCARSRAETVRLLAVMSERPLPRSSSPAAERLDTGPGRTVHLCDGLTQFAAQLADARSALTRGDIYEAEQLLQVPETTAPLPDHLRVVLLVERGALASLAGDVSTLEAAERDLTALGAEPEASLLAGLRLEADGSTRRALEAYADAASTAVRQQPATQAIATACQAQLLDLFGSRAEAFQRLREAVTMTDVRRHGIPFLGWSRLGTPIGSLLTALVDEGASPWLTDLAEARAGQVDIATAFVPVIPSQRERDSAPDDGSRPNLSTREREVLNGLARGATYADIAADLFVSENTIKSHVSSLYGKLTVNRRSEALAVARSLHLI